MNCAPNPFVQNTILLDFKELRNLNLNITFCNANQTIPQVQIAMCITKHIPNCYQEYFNYNIHSKKANINIFRKYYWNPEHTKIIIDVNATDKSIIFYEVKASNNLVQLASDIGGLLALWLGISIVDINVYIKSFLTKLKLLLVNYLSKLLQIIRHTFILNQFYNLISKLKEITLIVMTFLDNINMKALINLLIVPFMLYQIHQLIALYLRYETEVSIELIPHFDDHGIVRLHSLPTVTVCPRLSDRQSDFDNIRFYDPDDNMFQNRIYNIIHDFCIKKHDFKYKSELYYECKNVIAIASLHKAEFHPDRAFYIASSDFFDSIKNITILYFDLVRKVDGYKNESLNRIMTTLSHRLYLNKANLYNKSIQIEFVGSLFKTSNIIMKRINKIQSLTDTCLTYSLHSK